MPGGRPSKFRPEYVDRAKSLCEQGATDADLAAAFGVGTTTIKRWQSEHPEFRSATKTGKEPADERVQRSLFHRAVGYTFNSEEIRVLRDGTVVRVPTVEHVPPDVTAAIFWLKNRRPDEWRDIKAVELTGKDGGPIQTEDVSALDILSGRIAGISARAGAGEGAKKPH
jgi:hypothetical protein